LSGESPCYFGSLDGYEFRWILLKSFSPFFRGSGTAILLSGRRAGSRPEVAQLAKMPLGSEHGPILERTG